MSDTEVAGPDRVGQRLHLYAHLGIENTVTGELTAEAQMPVDAGILTPCSIRAALLALLIEGSFGGNILQAGLFPVLDNMTVHIRDGGIGVTTAKSSGELARLGSQRASAFGQVVDAADPSRLLAYATIGYFMIKPRGDYMPDRGQILRADEPIDRGDVDRPILDAMEMRVRTEDAVCELDAVHAGVLAPEGRLHGGAHQLMHEAAALAAASRHWGTDQVQVRDFSIRFVAPAMIGPFVATGTVISEGSDDLLCQVKLIDKGADERVRSLSTMRMAKVRTIS